VILPTRRVFVGDGWFGLRLRPVPSRYYILRNVQKHPPLFSERNGYAKFHRWLKIGRWEAGWK